MNIPDPGFKPGQRVRNIYWPDDTFIIGDAVYSYANGRWVYLELRYKETIEHPESDLEAV